MKTTKIILLAMFSMMYHSMTAQIFTTVIDEDALQFRVKQIDEFFSRFNYETDYKGDKPKDITNKEEHKKNLLTLVNLDKFSNEKKDIDSTLNKFIDYIIDNNEKIHYEDTTWCAEAKGSLTCDGEKYDVVFTLKTEQIKKYVYKWVITDIQSKLFDQYPNNPKDSISISPAEHGIGFMTLPETFNLNKNAVGTSFVKGYQRNNLAVFDFLMATGKIKMNAISKVLFHFQLQHAKFDVERIEKEKSYNQGWLINKIYLK